MRIHFSTLHLVTTAAVLLIVTAGWSIFSYASHHAQPHSNQSAQHETVQAQKVDQPNSTTTPVVTPAPSDSQTTISTMGNCTKNHTTTGDATAKNDTIDVRCTQSSQNNSSTSVNVNDSSDQSATSGDRSSGHTSSSSVSNSSNINISIH